MVADHFSYECEAVDWNSEEEDISSNKIGTNGYKLRTIFDVVRTGTLAAIVFVVKKYGIHILSERDDQGHTPIHWACLGGFHDIVTYMIEQGVDVDVPSYSPQGSHPIHWACAKGHISVVDILLQAKVSVDVCDAKGRSPLIIASQHGYIHLVGYLLGRGANRHLCDNNGDTALHWTAYKGYPELMRLLIYSGCNPEQQDSYGQTPLHLACLNGNYIVVQDLCEKDKVKIEVMDKEGRTPLILAEIKRHSDVINFLENEIRKRKRLLPQFNIW